MSFKLLVNNVHCQQVFFGGCSDIGYARALSSYSRDPVAAKKITFLKGPEWAKEMRAVKDNLDVHSFENTFRKTALPRSNKRTPLTIEPPTPKRTKMTVKKESPASEDLVLVPSRTPSQRRSQGAMQSPPPPDLIEKVRGRKLCMRFCLLGSCHATACSYSHRIDFDEAEMDVMRYIAKQRRCFHGSSCRNQDCIYGH